MTLKSLSSFKVSVIPASKEDRLLFLAMAVQEDQGQGHPEQATKERDAQCRSFSALLQLLLTLGLWSPLPIHFFN